MEGPPLGDRSPAARPSRSLAVAAGKPVEMRSDDADDCYAGIFQGFTSAIPVPSKSLILRVTSVIRRVKAVAAI